MWPRSCGLMCANLWLPRMESTGGAPCTPTRCGSNVFPDQHSLVNEILNVIVSWSHMMTPSSKAACMLEVCAADDRRRCGSWFHRPVRWRRHSRAAGADEEMPQRWRCVLQPFASWMRSSRVAAGVAAAAPHSRERSWPNRDLGRHLCARQQRRARRLRQQPQSLQRSQCGQHSSREAVSVRRCVPWRCVFSWASKGSPRCYSPRRAHVASQSESRDRTPRLAGRDWTHAAAASTADPSSGDDE